MVFPEAGGGYYVSTKIRCSPPRKA